MIGFLSGLAQIVISILGILAAGCVLLGAVALIDAAFGARYIAPQPSPAAQGDALDAERWRMAALVGNEVMVHPDKRNHAAAVAAYMQAVSSGLDLTAAIDAARAAQEGESHDN